MTVFEFAVTYVVCWWLVLFMVLPQGADAPTQPGLGHAPSAPANPKLGKKMRWTTLLAIIPAMAMYFVVDAVHAETMYHAGSGCKPLASVNSDDVNAKDGFGTHGKTVKSANLEQNTIYSKNGVDVPLWIPSEKYIDPTGTPAGRNVDLSQTYIRAGNINVKNDGTTTLDGKSITPQEVYPEGCAQPVETMTTKENKK